MKNVRAYLTGTVVLFTAVSLAGCNEEKKIAESDYHEQDTMEETTAHVIVDHLEESSEQEDKTDEFIFEEGDDDIVAQILKIEYAPLDFKKIANLLMDEVDAESYRVKVYDDFYELHKDEMIGSSATYQSTKGQFSYYIDEDQSNNFSFESWEYIEEGRLYNNVIDAQGTLWDGLSAEFRDLYPMEMIEGYDRETVIKACEKYAEALGYKDADVSTFALDMDVFRQAEENGHLGPDRNYDVSEYPFDELNEYWWNSAMAQDAGDNDLVNKLIDEEMALRTEIENKIVNQPWTKEDEAVLLIYRPIVNGMLMDGFGQDLEIIYVPSREKVVWIEGYGPVQPVEIQDMEKVVSKKAAEDKVRELVEEEIEVTEVAGVYSTESHLKFVEHEIHPCWRVDYKTKDDANHTKYVDAVTGEENVFYVMNNGL